MVLRRVGWKSMAVESWFGAGRGGGKESLQHFSNSADSTNPSPWKREMTLHRSPNTSPAPRQALCMTCLTKCHKLPARQALLYHFTVEKTEAKCLQEVTQWQDRGPPPCPWTLFLFLIPIVPGSLLTGPNSGRKRDGVCTALLS